MPLEKSESAEKLLSRTGFSSERFPPIRHIAPEDSEFTAYDAAHMMIYAWLLDAAREGSDWQDGAREFLQLDVVADPEGAELCWRSHYERAVWSISDEGLAAAAVANKKGWFSLSEAGQSQPR